MVDHALSEKVGGAIDSERELDNDGNCSKICL